MEPESALLIDLCTAIKGFRKLTAREDEKLKALVKDALEKALLERDWQWWETLACVDGVEPEPAAVKAFLLNIQRDFVEKPLQARLQQAEELLRCALPQILGGDFASEYGYELAKDLDRRIRAFLAEKG